MTSARRRSSSHEDMAMHNMPSPSPHPANVSLVDILEESITRSPLGEWLQSSHEDIHARLVNLASFSEGPGPSFTSSPPCSHPRSARSNASSMAPTCVHYASNASAHPPSLYHYSDATPTETSISTGLASQFSGVPLLEENNGVLERPLTQCRSPMYECAFWFLSCSNVFHEKEEWKEHCLSHFHTEEPPAFVRCPLCDFEYQDNDGRTAWNVRMDHIASEHVERGETLKTSRPDFGLFQHLWCKRLIDDQDLKELKGGNHNLERPPSNFTVTNSRRERDVRRQRTQHVGTRRTSARR
ncbi:hypothetical protein BU23DRAFT_574199 [Bimuria novae-zelandiae CBS 107.79]|uniref:C2H2-type domain-containing protein n=1 Tax=Bimuria novae-zelandiae CBS 107.79 TaxID=1447943 RepID=A0A6A5UN28_9PLEO|nr:hypothetical protein BU23DRAFT_574199 [Bimuria novae-zelandiae CBS 107.79]